MFKELSRNTDGIFLKKKLKLNFQRKNKMKHVLPYFMAT